MEYDRKCSTREKIVFFILNFKIWIESCVVLGFGIVGLTLKDVASVVTDGNLYTALVSVFIVVGCFGILSTFLGYCGAMTGNRGFMLIYIIYLGITLILLFTSAIIGFVFGDRLQRNSNDIMTESLKLYDLQASNSSTVKYGWDYLQESLHCCGVISYDDWRGYNEDFKGNQKIPLSCCVPDYYSKVGIECTAAEDEKAFYSSLMDGCASKVLLLFEKYSPIVVGIGAVDALLLIMGITCGGIAYTFL